MCSNARSIIEAKWPFFFLFFIFFCLSVLKTFPSPLLGPHLKLAPHFSVYISSLACVFRLLLKRISSPCDSDHYYSLRLLSCSIMKCLSRFLDVSYAAVDSQQFDHLQHREHQVFEHKISGYWSFFKISTMRLHVEEELLTLSDHLSSLSVFRGVRVAQSLVFGVMFCTAFFLLLFFFFWQLYWLSFDLLLQITSLV
jgi:hypothetical protein